MAGNFDQEFKVFLEKQIQSAKGRRLERLQKDLIGERKLFSEALWPVFKTFEGFTLEYEIKSISGVSIFVDAFHDQLLWALESDGFVAHAENITRDRFTFERKRVRTIALMGYKYIPFSWDELDKDPEGCRRSLYELLGRYTGSDNKSLVELSVYERELLRYARLLNRPLLLEDACFCLQLGEWTSRKVLHSLMKKQLIRPLGKGTKTIRAYELDDGSKDYML